MNARLSLPLLLLIVLNGSLMTAISWRLLKGSELDQLIHTEATSADMTFAAIDAPSVSTFDEILPRAIFHQSRSFYVPPPPEIAQAPPPAYRLAGSMTIAGKQSAVLLNSQTGSRLRVSAGDQVEGWTVAAIVPGKVTLQFGERVADITPGVRAQGGGVTMVGTHAGVTPAPTTNGVRILGHAPGAASRSQAVSNDPLNHRPPVYRPPQQ